MDEYNQNYHHTTFQSKEEGPFNNFGVHKAPLCTQGYGSGYGPSHGSHGYKSAYYPPVEKEDDALSIQTDSTSEEPNVPNPTEPNLAPEVSFDHLVTTAQSWSKVWEASRNAVRAQRRYVEEGIRLRRAQQSLMGLTEPTPPTLSHPPTV